MKMKLWGILLLLPLLVFGTASAAKVSKIYIQPAGDDPSAVSPRAVRLYNRNEHVYFAFLPTGMDGNGLRVLFSGDGTLTIDGTELHSGDVTDVLAGKSGQTLSIGLNGRTAKLTVMQSAHIPALFLTTASGDMKTVNRNKGNRETGTFAAVTADGQLTASGALKHIRLHGNGTLEYSKKPYQIKLEHAEPLFGMDKGKTWILLANAKDYTLLRNKIALDMALETGMQYALQSTFVDLYINHEYYGCYLLTEKAEVSAGRVDIADLQKATRRVNDAPLQSFAPCGIHSYKEGTRKGFQIPNDPEDITGGYLMEFELTYRYPREESGFVTAKGQPVVLKSPKYASEAQVSYISGLMQELEDAIFAPDGVNPATGKHYSEYADKDSLVMMVLLEEVVKNYDADRSSLYFYKPADSQSPLIHAGPGWDFDQALDNYGYEGPAITTAVSSSTRFHWFPHLYKLDDFRARLEELYREKFDPAMSILNGTAAAGTWLKSFTAYREEIASAAAMNYVRWGYTYVERTVQVGENFREACTHLKHFLERRQVYLREWWGRGE